MLLRSSALSRARNSDRSVSLSEAGDDPPTTLVVGNEIAAASEEELQLGDLLLTWLESSPRSRLRERRLVGDYMCISGVGFRLLAAG